MIRYDLQCAQGHDFDGWFRDSAAFESQRKQGQIACAVCGTVAVEKLLMSPSVSAKTRTGTASADGRARMLQKLREHLEANSDYVGPRFAETARAIHEGREPERWIHGEARPDEARALVEDGVPIAPLPFLPRRKTN